MRKNFLKELMPYVFMAVVMIIYHIFIHTQKMDDVAIYGDLLDYSPLLPWLKFRYETWTSRILIDGLIVLFVEYNPWIWKLLNIGCWLLFAHSIIRLTGCSKEVKLKYITVFMILIYPLFTMGSAGWCATQLNYLWPMSIGTFALTSLMIPADKPIHWYQWIIYIIATIFACSQEQMCAIFLAIIAMHLILSRLYRGKIEHLLLILVQLFLSIIKLFLILTCCGNQARKLVEVERWMPNYPLLSLRDKLYIGFTDTMERVVFHKTNFIFIIFTLILLFLVFYKTKTLWKCIFPFILSLTTIGGTYFLQSSQRSIPLYLLILICLMISFIFLSDNIHDYILYGTILGSGFITRVAVGYSPSIYVSGDRTCIFLYGTIIFCIIKLLYDNKNSSLKLISGTYQVTRLIALYCFMVTLIEFISRYSGGRL